MKCIKKYFHSFFMVTFSFISLTMEKKTVPPIIWNSFTTAICNGYTQEVRAHLNSYTFCDKEFNTALSLGIAYGQYANVIIILNAALDLNHTVILKDCEVNPARLRYDTQMAAILENYYKSVENRTTNSFLDRHKNYLIPKDAHEAILSRDQPALNTFLKKHDEPDEIHDAFLEDLLATASRMENIPAIRTLLSYGANPAPSFMEGINHLRVKYIQEVIKCRALNTLEIKDGNGRRPFDYANSAVIFEGLLEQENLNKQQKILTALKNPAPLLMEGKYGPTNIALSLQTRELGGYKNLIKNKISAAS